MSVSGKIDSKRHDIGLTLNEYLGRHVAAKSRLRATDKANIKVEVKVKVKPPPHAVKTIRELIFWDISVDRTIEN